MLDEMKFDKKNNRPKGKENRNDRKINAKNAFDVNVEYLENLPHLLKKNEETSWQKASACLDASAKIYGYRVDSVHSETFKFLGGLSRADKDVENKNDENENENEENKREKKREGRHDGFSTLEKDHKKLDLIKYDLEFEVDPLFKLMTAKFGDSGARGLLLKTLPLDSNLDVLLESKENPNYEKNELPKKNEINHSEKEHNPNFKNYPILENSQPENINTELRNIIDQTLAQFSVNDLKSVQICPDLSYFKKARDLESSLEKTFYQNFIQEFDDTFLRDNMLNEKINLDESLNDSINFADNIDNEMDNVSMSHRSSHESNLSGKFDDNINMNMNMINLNGMGNDIQKMMGVSYMEGFSYLKSDDIKEYIHQFGDGNKEIFKNLPQYKIFTKSFNQLEKFNSFNNNILNNLGMNDTGKKEKKPKKEEVLFEFTEVQEVKKSEIFEKESKLKKNINIKDITRKKIRKKVKQFYHYDRSVLFNLFSIQDRLINERTYNEENRVGLNNDNADSYSNQGDNELPLNEEERNNVAETFVKIDSEYEKKFGRLYKTFDVRLIKSKIWESISSISSGTNKFTNNKVNNSTNLNQIPLGEDDTILDFKQIISAVSSNLSKEILNNISTSTCFVCLLHLSNEKKEFDQNNFRIRIEPSEGQATSFVQN